MNGGLYWKIGRQGIKADNDAGTLDKSNGYIKISIDNKRYYEHRIVWLYHYGYLPKQIDHINGLRDDNRIENLREVNQSQNNMNQKKTRGTSKYKGVNLFKRDKNWMAKIQKNGKRYFLGYFDTEEEAGLAYNKKAEELFGEFAKLNIINKI